MSKVDITILTEQRYVDPEPDSDYIRNILLEDRLVKDALEKRGLRVARCSWDDPSVDWSGTRFILFRSTWDYFERFGEFSRWLESVRSATRMLNTYEVIRWNLDKHYLADLSDAGIPIPPTRYIEKGSTQRLESLCRQQGWREVILKPVVSGAARHTYRFNPGDAGRFEDVFARLISKEDMMIQEFQDSVPVRGEVTFMVIGGRFTHAVIKKARDGDFRVQDDFGGTVHLYHPGMAEIDFAEQVIGSCGFNPLYGRVDAVWDNKGEMVVSELELIEPELWFRFHPPAADMLAGAIVSTCF